MTTEWTYIAYDENGRPVAETLPDTARTVFVTYYQKLGGGTYTDQSYYKGNWYSVRELKPFPDNIAIYAWQPWPEPAPYLEGE